MAVFRIERTLDYTVMSNHHLKDTALSLKAKGLLSMMLSLPDEWNYTTRGLAAICKEGVDAIGGALRELEKAGYIVRRQLRGPGGRISDTEYTIYEKPCPGAEEPPEEPGPDTTPPDTGAPDTAFPYLVEPDMVEPSTEKPAELNTKRSNIQKSNTHLSNTHSFVLSTPELEGMKDVYEKREEIREQIEYDLICTPVNRTQVDEFVELMLEVAMTRSPTIKIGRDAEYPTAFVQQRFEQITSSHIEKVLDGISENNTRVWNAKAYLLAALFNAPSSTDNHYTMLVPSGVRRGFFPGLPPAVPAAVPGGRHPPGAQGQHRHGPRLPPARPCAGGLRRQGGRDSEKRHRHRRAPADHRHHAGRDSHRQGTGAEPLTHCRLLRRLRVPP